MGNLQLRTWLIALIAIAVLPSFFILLANYRSNQALTLERAKSTMEAVAGLAAATHEQSVEGVRQILGTISSGPSVRRDDLEHLCWEFIGNVAAASPSYSQIGVLTLDGESRCLVPNTPAPANLGDRAYFREAVTAQQFTVGEYVLGRLSQRKALTYAVPVFDYGNQLKGVAYVGLDLELVDRRFKDLVLDPSIQVFLVNSSGLLLASTQGSEEDIGTVLADEGLQSMLQAQRVGTIESVETASGRALYLLSPTQKTGVSKTFVVTRASEEHILGPGLHVLREQLLALMASALLGLLAAWAVAQQKIAQPMRRLVERMNQAGRGEPGSGVLDGGAQDEEPASSREFNSLHENLNNMLEKLQLQQAAVASSIDGIVISDACREDMPLVYVNPAFEQSTGYPAAEAIGRNCRFLQGNDHDQPGLRQLRLALAEHKEANVVIRNYRRDGTMFWNSLRIAPVRNARGVVTHYVGIQTDVTDRIQKEEELARRAYHDWLTGLPNRKLLEDRISQSIERAKREDFEFSVAFIDLDNFKVFNDSMGHRAGDTVLVEVAKRLSRSVRSQDTVCRIGGDEFVVVYDGLSDTNLLQEALERLQRCLIEPLAVEGREHFVAASIGLAVFPRDGDSAQTLLRERPAIPS